MKKSFAVLAAAVLAASLLAGCGADSSQSASAGAPSSQPASSQAAASQSASSQDASSVDPASIPVEPVEQNALYVLTNGTGEAVTGLYIYEAGSKEKGKNYAESGLAKDATLEVAFTAASAQEVEGKNYVLEFTTEGGKTQKFETLHFEKVAVKLLSVDAATSATPIEFGSLK